MITQRRGRLRRQGESAGNSWMSAVATEEALFAAVNNSPILSAPIATRGGFECSDARRRLSSFPFMALFIALGGAGYSATGGNFILGRSNSASSQTALVAPFNGPSVTIQNNATFVAATALRLLVAPERAPLIVNSRTKVTNLNADLLDGLNSTAFARSAQEGWHYVGSPGEPGFENGWFNPGNNAANNSQNAAFRMDNNGIIHIRGTVAGGAVGAPIFHPPSRYCPHFNHSFPVIAGGVFSYSLCHLLPFHGRQRTVLRLTKLRLECLCHAGGCGLPEFRNRAECRRICIAGRWRRGARAGIGAVAKGIAAIISRSSG